ncbi:MAG: SulP family inorganic anion transporter [Vulcanimicrobiota bacterium]
MPNRNQKGALLLALFSPFKPELKYWKGDLFGGLTIGVVALPLALAFGVSSGLEDGAKAGLYGSIILGFIAAIFGGTKPQVSGPTGPQTVVAAGFIATSPHPELIFVVVLLSGLLQITFGVLRLGHYVRYIPRPVISGFLTGIGVIIVMLQIQPMFGVDPEPGALQSLLGLPVAVANANSHALGLGLLTVVLVYLLPRISKGIPAALVALLVATTISEWMGLQVEKIGTLPTGLPSFSLMVPPIEYLPQVFVAAITLSILGALDSLLGSVVVDQITNTRHDSDKELVGQGMGNALCGVFGGLPGAGATMRTLLNIRVGGRTGLSGVIHALVLLIILLFLADYAALIPLSVLAGILVTVGFGIIDYEAMRLVPKSPRPDQIVLILVLTVTVLVDLITAVQFGFMLATLLFLQNLSDRELTRSGTLTPMVLSETPESQALADRVQVIQAEGAIFFGTSEAFVEAFDDDSPELRGIIIRMSRVLVIDQTGAFALQEFVNRMKRRNVAVILSGLPEAPTEVLRNLGVIPNVIPEESVYPLLSDAVEGLSRQIASTEEEALIPQPYLPKVGG